MPDLFGNEPSLYDGFDMECLKVGLQESAAILESQHLLAEVADLSEALWAQSALTDIFVGLVGQGVEVELDCGPKLHGDLTSVWREMILLKSGDYTLVPMTHVRSLRSTGAQPRLGEHVGRGNFTAALRRLLARGFSPVLFVCDHAAGANRDGRLLRWVGRDWVGFQRSGGVHFDFEVCSIEKVCAVRFSSLVTPSQIFVDFFGLNSPLPTSTNL